MSKRNFTTDRLSIERLREVLDYDPETGVFTWKIRQGVRGSRHTGKVAGSLNSLGYRSIRVDDVLHAEHRLALYWVNGVASLCAEIDHRDRNKSNNAFFNLREATQSENKQNTGLQSNNVSGLKGVSWCRRDRKWQAKIKLAGKQYSLGYFTKIEDAIAARKAAEVRYHPFRPTAERLALPE